LAVAILSLGSMPATAVAELDDFCSPTYPSDASLQLGRAQLHGRLAGLAAKMAVEIVELRGHCVERCFRTLGQVVSRTRVGG
jgi:hypothetical protein